MIYILLSLVLSFSLVAKERITSFDSDITVNQDGSMRVHETIKVKATGNQIRHGIVREFPTTYQDRFKNYYKVKFDVIDIKRDGKPEPYRIEYVTNGQKIYIGSKDKWLRAGYHTFEITYDTDRQIGFFDNHDELYWNVTGNGWRLPIDSASASVSLPTGITKDDLKVEGYTGFESEANQNYKAYVAENGVARFETTYPLSEFQGLTIVTAFPKGIIREPSAVKKWGYFISDNMHLLIGLLGLFCLLFFYSWAWRRVSKTEQLGTIIPLFYPPKDMLPGQMRYILNHGYDAKILAADIVNMAVEGFLKIEYKPGWVRHGTYTLVKQADMILRKSLYADLYVDLFSKKNRLTLASAEAKTINTAVETTKEYYETRTRGVFDFHANYTFYGVVISLATILGMFPFVDPSSSFMLILVGAVSLLIIVVMYFWLRGYTKKGIDCKREIEGFKLFLKTTEEDRLKVIGSPPTKTPELYEKYLPYAIALGVEKQWSAQFAPMFEEMAKAGDDYTFVWISGGDSSSFASHGFGSMSQGIGSSISSAVSSSNSSPGTSSGSGGGGSSGGGGGGGGGGGW